MRKICDLIGENEHKLCVYKSRGKSEPLEIILKNEYSKLRSVQSEKHFPITFHAGFSLSASTQSPTASLCLHSRLELIKFTGCLSSHLSLPLSLIGMVISSAPRLTNNVRARNSIFYS